ncbi:hypothetical protein [Dechloromonas agitata]|uniref:hypothetical protein n=1 Tax=Dechloromonas agitata TaxID=73030 RepID=UPI000480DEC0|nr:hypothetical protein [Dechloromonas agitata]
MGKGIIFGVAMTMLSAMTSANADEAISVIGTLARPAKLYEAPDMAARVLDTWPANTSFEAAPKLVKGVRDSFVQVDHNGMSVWVLIRSIKSNRQIRIAETCGSMPGDAMPRSAATRGVGEACK